MSEVTKTVADFIANAKYDDLPPEVVDKVKNILLDSIGCALGGYVTEKAKIVGAFIRELGGNPQATIIGSGYTSAVNAAFANGELINAMDMDCIGPGSAHVIPYVLPPCIALAEMRHGSGKELLLAAALAVEIGGRVGASLLQMRKPIQEPPYYETSPRYGFSTGVFGGTAGACKVLQMEADKIVSALGIAGASTPIPGSAHFQQFEGPLPMVKYNSWAGWVSQLGAVSALIANKGFTGDPSIFDGKFGFWQMYGSPTFRKELILGGLGKVWRAMETEFKPYPNCRCNHGGIDGIIKLMRENDIRPEDITKIQIWGDSWLLNPCRSHETIKNCIDTQFSVKYCFSVAACYGGNPGPLWEMPVIYENPKVMDMMKKVTVEEHPRANELILENLQAGKPPVLWLSTVKIMAKGKEYSTEILEPRGKGKNQLSSGDILRKFKENAAFSPLPQPKIALIIDLVRNLETIADVHELGAAIRFE